MDFGFFKGLPYKNSIENFEDYKKYKNSIPKEAILSHISSLDAGLTSLPSFDMFTEKNFTQVCFGTVNSPSRMSSCITTRIMTLASPMSMKHI